MTAAQALRQEAMQTKSLEIARKMLTKKEPQEKVIEFTGPSKQELEQVIKELKVKELGIH